MSEQGIREGENREKYVDPVFEREGVKGIALVGAFSVLEERGYEPQILKDLGIYEGEAFLMGMRDLLEAKGLRTFGDLVRRKTPS